ncbi:DNA repair protein RecO [Corynebacterium sp. TAE3-ERU12]|uniref:DNA repair protein RecO n=1 Tax=Corynebacterium sp. TAE3-ERU12 TaxID=2849491 RepID=UPI001C43E843|nr:DNA repair protein RecO [Corynebacterium sp. TAE3-ERU12]MBV7295775.1 DNA repair protein RecO [Corynebacterium sp. TAE3-ERU12]
MARPFSDRAVVVRRYDLGEADRIIVLLTRTNGLVRAVAKGVRRAQSRFGSRLSPFVETEVQLYPGRNLHTITTADTLRTWAAPIVDDYARYTCACAVLETSERLCGEEEPQPELYDLTCRSLAMLADGDAAAAQPEAVLCAHLLQAMRIAGWEPSLFNCAQCGKPGPHHAFSPAAGGAVCVECRPPGAATPPTEVLRLMWWLLNDKLDAVAAASQDPGFGHLLSTARNLTVAHLQWHIGRRVAALELADPRWQRGSAPTSGGAAPA